MTSLPAPPLSTYDIFEIAYLTGGYERVVDTAVLALVDERRIQVSLGGRLLAAALPSGHPVEAAVLDALGTRGRSLVTLRWRAADDHRLRSVAERLERDGLVASGRRLIRRSDPRPVLTAAGRRALRQLRADPSAHPRAGTVLDVAIGGGSGLADAELRTSIFGAPPAPRTGRPFRGHVTDEAAAHPAYLLPVWGGADGSYDAGGGSWGGGDCGAGGGDGGC